MKAKHIIFIVICFVFFGCHHAEDIQLISLENNPHHSSVRGLYQVNENCIWVSGTNGIIMVYNKGEWTTYYHNKFDSLDFRDIHAFNEKEAIIMSSGNGCEMYRTIDAGKSWNLVYDNKTEGIFFDGMDFWDDKNGIAFSDPINNQLFIVKTSDGGKTWNTIDSINIPATLVGEAGFAASGTGIQCVGENTVYIGTGGGEHARVFKSTNKGINWTVSNTPMRTGEASGIYSLNFIDEMNGVVVGGNYLDSTSTNGNCAITNDGGLTWSLPTNAPNGYRSCVTSNSNGLLMACGRTGVDISYDKGKNWTQISKEGYYCCVIGNKTGWLFGRNGKMAKITIK